MRLRVLGVCVSVSVAMLGAACSSNAKTTDLSLGTIAPTTTTVPSTTLPATTSVPPTTTTIVVDPTTTSTELATTTTAPAETTIASPPPTEAPPTTIEPTLEDQVKADFERARQARTACAYDPLSCDYAAVAVAGSPMDVATRDLMQFRIDNNLRAVPGRGEAKSRVESVGFEGDSAFVTSCLFDAVIVFDVADPSNPDDDIVYNDERNSYEARWELRKQDGQWLFFDETDLQSLKDGDLCGF